MREREARAAFRGTKELAASRERVNQLLHSMLPRDVVQRIQAGETAIADLHSEGLHVGTVVAGVIGVTRPAFDCWGESVNLASRIEGHATPGTILVSESADWRLKPLFAMAPQGETELKGIGTIRVFRLLGPVGDERGGAVPILA